MSLQYYLLAFLLAAAAAAAQQPPWNARDLFLRGAQPQPGRASTAPAGRWTDAPSSTSPLALRYSVLKRGGREFREVDPSAMFRSGDAVRFSIEPNGDGFLYLVHRGASGEWKMLFPAPEISGGDNYVQRGGKYEIPAVEGQVFVISPPAGAESLFVVLSRRPLDALDRFVAPSSEPRAPSVDPRRRPPSTAGALLAQRQDVDGRVLDGLRNSARTRGLVLTKMDDRVSGSEGDQGIYVADPNQTPEDYVVAEFVLNHR